MWLWRKEREEWKRRKVIIELSHCNASNRSAAAVPALTAVSREMRNFRDLFEAVCEDNNTRLDELPSLLTRTINDQPQQLIKSFWNGLGLTGLFLLPAMKTLVTWKGILEVPETKHGSSIATLWLKNLLNPHWNIGNWSATKDFTQSIQLTQSIQSSGRIRIRSEDDHFHNDVLLTPCGISGFAVTQYVRFAHTRIRILLFIWLIEMDGLITANLLEWCRP